ncbi:MAG: hypothetical protein ABIO94_01995 [Opitutaceae bacterium]
MKRSLTFFTAVIAACFEGTERGHVSTLDKMQAWPGGPMSSMIPAALVLGGRGLSIGPMPHAEL